MSTLLQIQIQNVFRQCWVCCRRGEDGHIIEELHCGGLDVAAHAFDTLGNIPFPIFLF